MTLPARMISVLTAIGLISGAFLAGVAQLTRERIALNIQAKIETGIQEVVDGAAVNEVILEEEDLTIYKGMGESGQLSGFAVQAVGVGFQDKITLVFGLDERVTRITGLAIITQNETPGLGAKITDWDAFLRFWEDRDATGLLSLRKPAASRHEDLMPSEINTITAATVSSRRVMEIVNLSLERVRALIKKGSIKREEQDGD
jgi:RnfABCDGE-type electron transport complex G subunit